MNIWDFVILAMVAAAVAGAILSIRRQRKKGKSSCSCSCEGCAFSGSCKKRES